MENETVNVRYMVENVETSIERYVAHLGFSLISKYPPAFADVQRGALRLLLSGAMKFSRPPDGQWLGACPGGWTGSSSTTLKTKWNGCDRPTRGCATTSSRARRIPGFAG
jgi:hypothetical protein